MKIVIPGAHNVESKDTGCTCLLIDDVLAVDAGALTSTLSFPAQSRVKTLLLTHRHYDHVKDVPVLGINFFRLGKQMDVYSTQPVYDDLAKYLMDGYLYPDFRVRPADKPAFKFHTVEPGREETIDGYSVLPVPVKHTVPTVGFQISRTGGKKLFYTSDTGPGLADCWRQVSPDLLIIEVTYINKHQDFALEAGHLTPALLRTELESFRAIKGYLPRLVTVHANPSDEKALTAELADVAKALKTEIQVGREGMSITL